MHQGGRSGNQNEGLTPSQYSSQHSPTATATAVRPTMRSRRETKSGERKRTKGRGTASATTSTTARRPGAWVRAVQEVTRGGSAYGPPPEPDVRATALKRAACASPRGRRKSQPVRGGGASSSTGSLSPPFIFLYLWAAAVILFSTSLIDLKKNYIQLSEPSNIQDFDN